MRKDDYDSAYEVFKSSQGTLAEYLTAKATNFERSHLGQLLNKIERIEPRIENLQDELEQLEALSDEDLQQERDTSKWVVERHNRQTQEFHDFKVARAKDWAAKIKRSPRLKDALAEIGIDPVDLLEHYASQKLHPLDFEEVRLTDAKEYREHTSKQLKDDISRLNEKLECVRAEAEAASQRLKQRKAEVRRVLDSVSDRL